MDCNDTTSPQQGVAHASSDCSDDFNISYIDGIPAGHSEVWAKFDLLLDGNGASHTSIIFEFQGASGATLTQGLALFQWQTNATVEKIRAFSGDDNHLSDDPAYTDNAWGSYKMHVSTTTGAVSIWLSGSDFTGAADLVATDSSPVTQDIRGLRFVSPSAGNCTKFYWDNFRVYGQDPD